MAAPIKMGIVGTGRMAAAMIRTISTLPEVEIAAIASGDSERARRFADAYSIPNVAQSAIELVSLKDVNAVYIANRTANHVAAAIASLSAAKPVLVEKPLAASSEDGEMLIAHARAQRCLLVENLWCLTLPAYQEFASRFRSGRYGDPVQLTFDFGYPMDRAAFPALFDSVDGGVLNDRGVYGLSLALSLLGPVRKMCATVQRNNDGLDVAAAIQLTHTSGAVSQLAFSINALMANSASLACSEGILQLASPTIGSESVFERKMLPLRAPFKLTSVGLTEWIVSKLKTSSMLREVNRWRLGPSKKRFPYRVDPYQPILKHFCELVRSGSLESKIMPLDLSLDILRLVDAARQSDNEP